MLTTLTGSSASHRQLIGKTQSVLGSCPQGLISYVYVHASAINTFRVHVFVDNVICPMDLA